MLISGDPQQDSTPHLDWIYWINYVYTQPLQPATDNNQKFILGYGDKYFRYGGLVFITPGFRIFVLATKNLICKTLIRFE
ncbi:hypothetical protein CLI64_00195 [Nostoc sp. CENA543]|nr:hypothetical protein CLI64_00195 [Nostoc sp. CENA543]